MRLRMIDTETGREVAPGSERQTFRGEPVTVTLATRASMPGKSGKVCIQGDGEFSHEVYAGVVGLDVEAIDS